MIVIIIIKYFLNVVPERGASLFFFASLETAFVFSPPLHQVKENVSVTMETRTTTSSNSLIITIYILTLLA